MADSDRFYVSVVTSPQERPRENPQCTKKSRVEIKPDSYMCAVPTSHRHLQLLCKHHNAMKISASVWWYCLILS